MICFRFRTSVFADLIGSHLRFKTNMAGTLPPLFPISAEDHSGYVAVTVYTLLSLTVATVLVRLFTRWYIARVVYTDDILLAGATVWLNSIAQLELQTSNGQLL